MDEDVREMLAKLKFSNEEARKLFTLDSVSTEEGGWEAWVVRKLLIVAKVNREAMYRVLRSLWYTKEWVNFVEVGSGCFPIKFGTLEDRDRIFCMALWLFDQHILSMVLYVKDKAWSKYNFQMVPF